MGTIERVALGIIVVAGVTTLILPDRLTVQVANALGNWFNRSLRTATGQRG
jgi:hypothetical protein